MTHKLCQRYVWPHGGFARALIVPVSLLVGCAAASPGSGPVRAEAALGTRSAVVRTHEPSAPIEAARHREACDQGEPSQCHGAALDAYYKPSSPENDRTAFQLFKKACDAGYAPSCNGLGVLFAEGRGVGQDLAQAAQLYHIACVAGASTGCQHLADALSRGRGVSQDEAAANRARVRAQCVFAAALSNGGTAACPAVLSLPGRGP